MTTTIRLSEKLKKRLAKAARQTEQTSHALILEAVERRVEELEQESEFHRRADKRWAAFLKTGKAVSARDGKAFILALARGGKPRRPTAKAVR